MDKIEGNPINLNETTKKKIEPITSNVKQSGKENKLAKNFFVQDIKSTGKNVFVDTIVPGLKRLMSDTVKRAIDFFLYGSAGSSNTIGGYTAYGNISRVANTVSNNPYINQPRPYEADNGVFNVNSFEFSDYAVADSVLTTIKGHAHVYGSVAVGDFYDAISQKANMQAYKWGWTYEDIMNVQVSRTSSGRGYFIPFPRPKQIEA